VIGLVVLEIKLNIFHCTNSQFFSGLITAQVVDTFSLYRDFPALLLSLLMLCFYISDIISSLLFFKDLKSVCWGH
jgi:uncharacterized membrane protein YobD (UPF0266 family)